MLRVRMPIAFAVFSIIVPQPTQAQRSGRATSISLQTAIATGGPFSVIHTVALQTVDVTVAWPLRERGGWRLDLPLTFVPVAVVRGNALGATDFHDGHWWLQRRDRTNTRGVGMKPLGVRALRRIGPTAIVLGVGTGVVWFDRPAPGANASHWNFLGDLDGALRVPAGRGLAIEVGYRFSHISNIYTAAVNPGIDSHMLRLGLGRR